jgi:hypothetical protein
VFRTEEAFKDALQSAIADADRWKQLAWRAKAPLADDLDPKAEPKL